MKSVPHVSVLMLVFGHEYLPKIVPVSRPPVLQPVKKLRTVKKTKVLKFLLDLSVIFNVKFGEFQEHIHSGEQGEQGVKLFCNMAAQMSHSFPEVGRTINEL